MDRTLDKSVLAALGLVVAVLLGSAVITYHNTRQLDEDARRVAHTHDVLDLTAEMLRTLVDAETGERGFIITGKDEFLQPFDAALQRLEGQMATLQKKTEDNQRQQERIKQLQAMAVRRTALLQKGIALRRKSEQEAQTFVASGASKAQMDAIRTLVAEMQQEEHDLLRERERQSHTTYTIALTTGLLTTALGVVMVGLFYGLLRRSLLARQKAAAAVREQKEWLRTTLASIGDAVIATDTQGTVTFLNGVAETLTGWKETEAKGQSLETIFRIVNEDTRQTVENPALRALKEGTIVGLANHTILIAKDGSERPLDDSAAPIRDAAGNVAGSVLVFRDITERKREEIAQAERTRLTALRADVSTALASQQATPTALQHCCEALVRHLDVAFARIWTLDDTNKVLELQASAGVYTHLNGSHSRVPVGQFKIGRIASTRQPHLSNAVPDDPNVSDRAWALREGMVAFAGYPLLVEGRVVGVVAMFARKALTEGVLTDLAPLAEGIAQFIDRRQADERFRRQAELHRVTLASIGDAVLTTDDQGRVTFLNDVAVALTGWTSEQALGQPIDAIFHIVNEDTDEAVENPVGKVLREGTIVGLANHTALIARDGTQWPIEDSAAPIKDDQGRTFGVVLVFHEVTARRDVENALRSSEERLNLAVDTAGLGLWDWDVGTGEVLWNTHHETIFGYKPGQPKRTYRDFADRILPEDLQHIEASFRHAMQERREYRFEHRVVWPEGTTRWVEAFGRFHYDANGQAKRSVGVLLDVTERKQAEQEILRLNRDLQRRVTEFQSLLEVAPVGIAVADDPECKHIWTNPAMSRLLGLPPQINVSLSATAAERPGYKVYDSGRELSPDELPLQVALATRQTVSGVKHDLLLPDGTWVSLLQYAIPLYDEQGSIRGGLYVGVDVTEQERTQKALREAEQRWRTMAEALPNLVWTDLPDGQCDWLSSQWRKYTGIPESELLGLRWLERVLHPDDRERTLACWQAACADQGDYDLEYRIRRYDGEYRWFRTRGVPLRDEQGKIIYWFGTCTDIEENKRLEAALREADRRKDEFLATLAHELRNPLAPIRNGLQVMRLSGGDGVTVDQTRTMMERQLAQMVRLVDDLMDVSRISRGKIELQKERVELAAVVHSAVETSRPLIEQMGHELTVTLPKPPVVVHADLTRLAQVFLNLLNNAAKYTERGGRIWLTAERQGSDVVVSVKDNGIGIAAHQLPLLFEMFAQLNHSLERAQGGLGIGLTLVKRLVELHDGRIEARSDGPGKGSEFLVRLPVVVEASKPHKSNKEERAAIKSSLRILVVDDNRDGADSLSMMLKMMGNDTRTAYDGEEAVAVAVEFQPDVILLDIGLPKLTGYEACRQIRNQPGGKELVIIAQTGWGQEEDRQRTHEAGFDHHMVKPVDPQALMNLLSELQEAKG